MLEWKVDGECWGEWLWSQISFSLIVCAIQERARTERRSLVQEELAPDGVCVASDVVSPILSP